MITLDKIKTKAAKQVQHEMNKVGVINELLRINLEFLIVDAYLQGQIDRIDQAVNEKATPRSKFILSTPKAAAMTVRDHLKQVHKKAGKQ